MSEKPISWLGSSLKDAREFPDDARRIAGYQLYRLQCGLQPNDWKPMPSVGSGVQEIRIHTRREHRIIYLAKFEDAIYILHAFEKKSQKTTMSDLKIAKKRLVALMSEHTHPRSDR